MKNFKCENVVCKDICETKSDEIPNCDIVVGGFPCQSFSTVNPTKIHLTIGQICTNKWCV